MKTEAQWTAEIRWPTDAICPLGRLLRATEIRPAPSSPEPEAEIEIYLYARVGTEDAFAFPDLLAGSVVRIDKREPDRFLPLRNGQSSRVLFLVEHARDSLSRHAACTKSTREGRPENTVMHHSKATVAPPTDRNVIVSTIANP
jgi:hypothetical protein